jgi:hypothetical protein
MPSNARIKKPIIPATIPTISELACDQGGFTADQCAIRTTTTTIGCGDFRNNCNFGRMNSRRVCSHDGTERST